MHGPELVPVLTDCPRCGGWARRVEKSLARWHCRGCRWRGAASP